MIAGDITNGHVLLADWLFLIAAVVFLLVALLPLRTRADGARADFSVSLLPLGLCLVSVAWLVL